MRKLYLPDGARHFLSRQAYNLAYENEHLDDREWPGGACANAGAARQRDTPMDSGEPYPRRSRRGCLFFQGYARLLDRLDAAEDDLDPCL